MKKVLFMLFAISAVGYAGSDTQVGPNKEKTDTTSSTTAAIDVQISAKVEPNPYKGLIIKDTNGSEISAVVFEHKLIEAPTTGQTEKKLSIEVRAHSNDITSTNLSANFDAPNYVLTNTAAGQTIGGKLERTLGAVNNNNSKDIFAPITIASTLNSGMVFEGSYNTDPRKLTVIVDKTK